MRERELERLNKAWEVVNKEWGNFREDFLTPVRRLPSLIMSSGLAASLAYLKKEHPKVYEEISRWVSEIVWGEEEDLLEILRKGDIELYLWATEEALAFAGWLKRLGEAREKSGASK